MDCAHPRARPKYNGAEVEWRNISFSVPEKKKGEKVATQKQILNSVSGFAEPGTLTAILGSSPRGQRQKRESSHMIV